MKSTPTTVRSSCLQEWFNCINKPTSGTNSNIVEAGDTPITVNPDVNGDGVVDIDDVNIVVNAILHK